MNTGEGRRKEKLIRDNDVPLMFVAATIFCLLLMFAWTAPWPQLCGNESRLKSGGSHAEFLQPALMIKKGASEQSVQQCDEHAASDWWTIRIGLGTIAVLLVQLAMFFWQLRAMRDGLIDARKAATAASDNARAALISAETSQRAERAYIKMSHITPKVADARQALEWYEATTTFDIRYEVKNFGRTPARVTSTMTSLEVLDQDQKWVMPEHYWKDSSCEDPESEAFLVCEDRFEFSDGGEISDLDKADVLSGKKVLLILGCVDYIDQFNGRHRAGYARQLLPGDRDKNNLVFPNDIPNSNYDRPRNPGEGKDWNC